MRILLLCSAFNGLSQRAWVELRDAGHEVSVQLAGDDAAVRAGVLSVDPDLIICPFLRQRVPADIWTTRRTIVLHPGPKGDRGPSSLDWAIMNAEPVWGVTALQAVQEMDAGPIWASGTFVMPAAAPCKSGLYGDEVTETAIALIHDVVHKAADPTFTPQPLDYRRPDVWGKLRPAARQADRHFDWSDPTAHVLRRIRAADGSPGVHTSICGLPVTVYDAHPAVLGAHQHGAPGTVAARRHGAVLVRTGDGAVWIGQLRARDTTTTGASIKLPATTVLADRITHTAELPEDPAASEDPTFREISYRRRGRVGTLTFRFYNGAMSTEQCRRLRTALRHAASQDTRVLLLQGGQCFSNGIHLGVIEAAADPAAEAWANIIAIDDLCRDIITCTHQLIVSAIAGNAGAGGVMLALGADRVVLREGVVLNPHYKSMGLYGSEYWTYLLPRRVGHHSARTLTDQCLPVGAVQAHHIGLADHVLPGTRATFGQAAASYAARLADTDDYRALLAHKRATRRADEQRRPLRHYRRAELDQMSLDIHHNRRGFTHIRRRFITHAPTDGQPPSVHDHTPQERHA